MAQLPFMNLSKLLILTLLSVGTLPASAIVRLADLGPLEVRFFSHQYEKETPSERLGRLETLVFGGVQSGSIEERVAKLSKAVDGAGAARNSVSTSNAARNSAISQQNPVPTVPKSTVIGNSSNYPRVAELERSVLGKTYLDEPVRQRLSRLETKAYGKPSQIEDLATRVDKLSSYANVYGMSPVSSHRTESLRGSTDLVSAPPRNQGMGILDKVSSLEKTVYGHATTNQALVQRIRSLEATVLGSSTSGEDMTTRVNHLWTSVNPSSANPSNAIANNSPIEKSAPPIETAQTLQPFSGPDYAQQNSLGNNLGRVKHHHKHKHHHSLLGKIGKVVVFAGSAAVGASALAVGAVGSMNTGSYMGMGTGFGGSYPSSLGSYAPSYGSPRSFGSISSGMGSPFNSSYAGSFFSR